MVLLMLIIVLGVLSKEDVLTLYKDFIQKYEKKYLYNDNTDIFKEKYEIFQENYETSQELNLKFGPNAKFGVTKFFDLSMKEFKSTILTSNIQTRHHFREEKGYYPIEQKLKLLKDVPDEWNWVEQGAVTSVRNQGLCANCWAQTGTAAIEAQYFLATGQLIELSQQQITDCCNTDPGGCGGGVIEDGIDYVIKKKLEKRSDYKDAQWSFECDYDKSKAFANITSYIDMKNHDADLMKNWVYNIGPMSAVVVADLLLYYTGGVFYADSARCPPDAYNHGVTIVGYGVEASDPYWLVKNSWGKSWGIDGYLKIYRGKNCCGIEEGPIGVSRFNSTSRMF